MGTHPLTPLQENICEMGIHFSQLEEKENKNILSWISHTASAAFQPSTNYIKGFIPVNLAGR